MSTRPNHHQTPQYRSSSEDYGLDTLSKKELQRRIADLGVSPATGKISLLRKQLRECLIYLDHHPNRPIPSGEYAKPREYTPVEVDRSIPWRRHLRKYGFAVVPRKYYLPRRDLNEIIDGLYTHLESPEGTPFDRNDPETWKSKNLPPNLHGIFKHCFGHEDFVWKAREHAEKIYRKVYSVPEDTSDLVVSFDGGCFLTKREKLRSWYHCDTHRDYGHSETPCYQGYVNLFPCGPEDGGTLLIESSHIRLAEYSRGHPESGYSGFWKVDPDDPLMSGRRIKPCLEEGDFLIWDGRMVHCNTPPTRDTARACIYVSYQPRECLSTKDAEKRRKAFDEGRQTGHWTYGPGLGVAPALPRVWAKGQQQWIPDWTESPEETEFIRRVL